jgi:hypothetical protein
MKILLNHNPIERLSQRDLKLLTEGAPIDEIIGSVLSGEAATAKVLLFARIFFVSIGVFAGGLEIWVLFNIARDASPMERQLIMLAAITVFAVIGALFRFAYQRTASRWMERLPDRVAAMPAPGTEVRLDANGVSIGTRTGAWSKLRIDQLELVRTGFGEDVSMLIERVMLAGVGELMTLDCNLIENGKQMVETACGHLLRRDGLGTNLP